MQILFLQRKIIYDDDEYMINNIQFVKTDAKQDDKKERKFDDIKSENLGVKKKPKSSKNVRVKTDIGEKKRKKKRKKK